MRQFDKNLALATVYSAWLAEVGDGDHPEYNSSRGPHYRSIVANLLWLQGGLCAYTEGCLIDPDEIEPAQWAKGVAPAYKTKGDLDHYNPTRKDARGWEWENFFVVDGDVNRKVKCQQSPHGLLKPDKPGYDPFYYLEYDFATHYFKPCQDRDKVLRKKILEDINILGLNYGPVVYARRITLMPLVTDIEFGMITLDGARERLKQFYTAFEMSIQSLGLG